MVTMTKVHYVGGLKSYLQLAKYIYLFTILHMHAHTSWKEKKTNNGAKKQQKPFVEASYCEGNPETK